MLETKQRTTRAAPQNLPDGADFRVGSRAAFGAVPPLVECIATLLDFRRWTTLGWMDVRLRYRRTVLGPWWATISVGALIGSVGLVFGTLFGQEMSSYLPFFAVGMILWNLISNALVEGGAVFMLAGGLIKSVPAPLVLHAYRMQWRLLIAFAHNAVLIIGLWAIFHWPIDWSAVLAVPGLVLICVAMVGIVLTLGILCTRFRDIPPIIQAVTQLLFLLTPIVWKPTGPRAEQLGLLLDWNPFYYLISVVREPLLDETPPLRIWAGAAVSAAGSLGIGLVLYSRFRHRVAYWL
jgi:ABC-2 type transport system permease protein